MRGGARNPREKLSPDELAKKLAAGTGDRPASIFLLEAIVRGVARNYLRVLEFDADADRESKESPIASKQAPQTKRRKA